MAQKQTDIVIIGGGVAGLCLAILLGQIGLGVDVVEPAPPPVLDKTARTGRSVALMESSLNILRATGIWDALAPFSNPLQIMRIIDDSVASRPKIDLQFPAHEIGLEQFGFNIPNAILRAALFEKTSSIANITILNDHFASYEADDFGVTVTTGNDQIHAKLLIGADGRNSPVRKAAGIHASIHDYNQSAMTCVIRHSLDHHNTSTEFHRPAGPLALVPLPENYSSIVWVETREKAENIIRLKKQDFEQRLQEEMLGVLGEIAIETGPECWPLSTVKAKALTAPRLALLAEAAHVMSPITAQGLNLSLRDVAALAESIADAARLGLDIGAETTLRTYEKRRRMDIDTRVMGVDGMNRIVSTDWPALKNLRRAGLKTVGNVPPVKTLAMHFGLAPQIDAGRLVKGEAL